MKNIKTFESLDYPWEDWSKTRLYQQKIQDYFFQKYPKRTHILNQSGPINLITLDIVYRFAKRRKDTELIKLIDDLYEEFEICKLDREARKYNL